MENILADHLRWRPSFLRTSNGAEIDLILERGGRRIFFEFKLFKAPKLSRGFFELVNDMQPDRAMVIAPVDEPYKIRRGIWVMPQQALSSEWIYIVDPLNHPNYTVSVNLEYRFYSMTCQRTCAASPSL